MSWNPRSLPDQAGKTFVVTGANAGLGYFTSEQLAGAGAHVVLACRNPVKADAAAAAIRLRVPGASVSVLQLDVSDLQSVREVSETLRAFPRLDGLILNAGIVHPPTDRVVSLDGNELVFATNFLGHFALTAGSLMALRRTPGSRVVSLGSLISRLMDSSLDDLQLATTYSGWKAYAQSKIAMQVFGFELDRRLRANGAGMVQSLVAHPGYSISGLTLGIRSVNEVSRGKRVLDGLQLLVGAQSKQQGAWSTVRAAIDPDANGGDYFGPSLLLRGRPVRQPATRTSRDRAVAARLWERAETLIGDPFL
ncbi:SDR family NAD(P)-dependent oxidoreductase [Cryobacterium luteum]|uniref:SDR family NAD(P)-dependent oxidoreductase n=1 Tax=Cryobacterium luteum TaxID=1424661 RepID=A0A1H8HC11_9MICO|nr:SDR family NAD(P)-dependent oxidoreductase [Cryobacterium luteum]TFB86716.1 SDR family NAD(P)-dependent oxidoreductase [Cryobacterium luteum]SEN53640.1 NAD(P)-dependent dehydrogenase, short-chain alcohol dehydrogenase family [Cryobacterium luteum]